MNNSIYKHGNILKDNKTQEIFLLVKIRCFYYDWEREEEIPNKYEYNYAFYDKFSSTLQQIPPATEEEERFSLIYKANHKTLFRWKALDKARRLCPFKILLH